MQISFFSFINFFQPTFIALTLCTEHFFKHRVFKGKAAEALGVQAICHVMADAGSYQLLPPAWGHFLPSGIFSCPFAWAKNSVF